MVFAPAPRIDAAEAAQKAPTALSVPPRKEGRRGLSIAPHGRRSSLPAEEALAAIYRPALGWLEGYRGFPAALRAGGHGFRLGKARGRGTRALGLAILAALRLVFEILVVEEVLFSRCEYEICSAVYALEDAVLEIRHINCAPLVNLNYCRIQMARAGRNSQTAQRPPLGLLNLPAILLPVSFASQRLLGP